MELEANWVELGSKFPCSDNLGQTIWNKWNNPVKLERKRKVWDVFLRFFNCYRQSLSSWRETRHQALCSPKIVYQVCCTRYQVSLYLWWIGSVVKCCKVPKYYDQDSWHNICWPHLVLIFHCTKRGLRISSLKATKSTWNCGFGHIYSKNSQ